MGVSSLSVTLTGTRTIFKSSRKLAEERWFAGGDSRGEIATALDRGSYPPLYSVVDQEQVPTSVAKSTPTNLENMLSRL
jgi:hypothetical protein